MVRFRMYMVWWRCHACLTMFVVAMLAFSCAVVVVWFFHYLFSIFGQWLWTYLLLPCDDFARTEIGTPLRIVGIVVVLVWIASTYGLYLVESRDVGKEHARLRISRDLQFVWDSTIGRLRRFEHTQWNLFEPQRVSEAAEALVGKHGHSTGGPRREGR